jgi:hypothetical protein
MELDKILSELDKKESYNSAPNRHAQANVKMLEEVTNQMSLNDGLIAEIQSHFSLKQEAEKPGVVETVGQFQLLLANLESECYD